MKLLDFFRRSNVSKDHVDPELQKASDALSAVQKPVKVKDIWQIQAQDILDRERLAIAEEAKALDELEVMANAAQGNTSRAHHRIISR